MTRRDAMMGAFHAAGWNAEPPPASKPSLTMSTLRLSTWTSTSTWGWRSAAASISSFSIPS